MKKRALEEALDEQKVLLKEVHHRVKNNLAIISSLLQLQSSGLENEFYKNLLESSQNRVQSMAIVHEQIYENEAPAEGKIGLMLIQNLLSQIKGSLKMDTEGRTFYEILF